jgi:hypothetical protein
VSIDAFAGVLYVYHGCNPTCTLVGGPYSLHGASFYGNLNRAGNRLALGDWGKARWTSTPTRRGITYKYSFDYGLTRGDLVESGIFSPSNNVPSGSGS